MKLRRFKTESQDDQKAFNAAEQGRVRSAGDKQQPQGTSMNPSENKTERTRAKTGDGAGRTLQPFGRDAPPGRPARPPCEDQK